MPYGRCVVYSFRGDAHELIEKAREGMLPIFKQQPGFLAYGVMVEGDQLISMSAWNSEGDAKGADEAARDWVAKNADMTVVNSFIGDYAWLEFAQQ
jgi:heme-degrading monooxygenase HmoA